MCPPTCSSHPWNLSVYLDIPPCWSIVYWHSYRAQSHHEMMTPLPPPESFPLHCRAHLVKEEDFFNATKVNTAKTTLVLIFQVHPTCWPRTSSSIRRSTITSTLSVVRTNERERRSHIAALPSGRFSSILPFVGTYTRTSTNTSRRPVDIVLAISFAISGAPTADLPTSAEILLHFADDLQNTSECSLLSRCFNLCVCLWHSVGTVRRLGSACASTNACSYGISQTFYYICTHRHYQLQLLHGQSITPNIYMYIYICVRMYASSAAFAESSNPLFQASCLWLFIYSFQLCCLPPFFLLHHNTETLLGCYQNYWVVLDPHPLWLSSNA